MTPIDAIYYDGIVSAPRQVRLSFDRTGTLRVDDDELHLTFDLADVSISARVGNSARSFYLPGGAKCESFDNDAIDEALTDFGEGSIAALLHGVESHWRSVLFALVTVAVALWASIQYGVPAAARLAADGIPPTVAQTVGENGLESLDGTLLEPSQLDAETRERLAARMRQIIPPQTGGPPYRLEFRGGGALGANALALPGGIIVVTDELVALAEDDDEIMAVLAHEAGHVENRHGLRSLFQNSLSALLLAGLLGDVTSISALSATIPTILVQSRYSREFEQQADQYALTVLQASHIAPERFAAILQRLEQQRPFNAEFDYLSTHPATEKRIKGIRDGAALQEPQPQE